MTKVFCYGSNLRGVHGAGAALYAKRHHGAIQGKGEGLAGTSYGIPTKDARIKTLPLPAIAKHVETFLEFARAHPELTFQMTPIGCGLAGYKPAQIAPMFAEGVPPNVELPREFLEVLAHR